MPHSDRPLVELGDLGTALRVMTVLPASEDSLPGRGLLSVWAWPLAGLLVAVLASVTALLISKMGMAPGLAAAAVLASLAALSGARHEGALVGLVQSLFNPSQTGADLAQAEEEAPSQPTGSAAGSTALMLVILGRWSALTVLLAEGHGFAPIVAAAVLSRGTLPLIMVALPAAGAAHSPSLIAPPRVTAALGLIIALCLGLLCLGWALIPSVAAAGVMAVAVALLGHYKLGGRSADLVGAAQLIIELGVLSALSASL